MSAALEPARPLRKPNVWLRQSDTENLVYDPDGESVHMLNPTAMAIWVLCDGETTPEEMIDAICELSGLPREVVMEDVRRVLAQFTEADILRWRT
ncbi:MAG: PqqD family protein [Candidatus Velamenicoccus archaeovorus]